MVSSRAPAAALVVTLDTLPDHDTFQQVIDAFCSNGDDLPPFCAVKGLGCLSKGMRQQIHRLRPLVGVRSPVGASPTCSDPLMARGS